MEIRSQTVLSKYSDRCKLFNCTYDASYSYVSEALAAILFVGFTATSYLKIPHYTKLYQRL